MFVLVVDGNGLTVYLYFLQVVGFFFKIYLQRYVILFESEADNFLAPDGSGFGFRDCKMQGITQAADYGFPVIGQGFADAFLYGYILGSI